MPRHNDAGRIQFKLCVICNFNVFLLTLSCVSLLHSTCIKPIPNFLYKVLTF